MTEVQPARAKAIYTQSDDPWIEVLCFSDLRGKTGCSSFRSSQIVRLDDLEDGKSALVLPFGGAVVLNLPYKDVTAMIQEGHSPVDLKPHCDIFSLSPGDRAADGSIYLGALAKQRWFVTAKGDGIQRSFNDAADHARSLTVHGHHDWQLPPAGAAAQGLNILQEMFNKRDVGAFRNTYPENWHWSSTKGNASSEAAYQVRFSDGVLGGPYRETDLVYVRCVRSSPSY